MKRLVLIDGYALLHRAYHAFPLTLKTRQGELVNAVYGFTRMLLTVLADLNPDFLAVALDLPQPTFRHREYLGYQIQRPEMDKELAGQIERVYQIIEVLKIPLFAVPGFEADDVIGTLARQAVQSKRVKEYKSRKKKKISTLPLSRSPALEVIIVTGDKDLMQLVNKRVKVYVPKKGFAEPELFDEKKVKLFLGITPQQVVDYKALVGDTSDNYPGVSGIGPKTAVELLNQYQTLAGIYQNLGKIKPTLVEKLKAGKEEAFLSKKLATIVTDVPLRLKLKDCLVHDYDHQKAIKLFEELEFKSLIDRLPGIRESKKVVKKVEQAKLF